jgi:GST-like protein
VALTDFPQVERWYNLLMERPAVRRGIELLKDLRASSMSEEARKALFGQTAQSVRAGDHKLV